MRELVCGVGWNGVDIMVVSGQEGKREVGIVRDASLDNSWRKNFLEFEKKISGGGVHFLWSWRDILVCSFRSDTKKIFQVYGGTNHAWLLHHNNASLLVRNSLGKNNTVIMPQPPYSPDLASCVFFPFSRIQVHNRKDYYKYFFSRNITLNGTK